MPLPSLKRLFSSDQTDDGISPGELAARIYRGASAVTELSERVDQATLSTSLENEDEFFTTSRGNPTVVTRYDLETEVPDSKKRHLKEIDRYWVNKPYAFVILFRNLEDNEIKYYTVEPHLNAEETRLREFLDQKLRDTIKFSEGTTTAETPAQRAGHIEEETHRLLKRYNLITTSRFDSAGPTSSLTDRVAEIVSRNQSADSEDATQSQSGPETLADKLMGADDPPTQRDGGERETIYISPEDLPVLDGHSARREKARINDGSKRLTEFEVEKLVYYLIRDSVGYQRIDPIKHDIRVEDISCDGTEQAVWVYHSGHEQIITNVTHGSRELDDFVIGLAQRSGKSISKREPQLDVTLPDGSRGQLTLGDEVSDHGTNYTIRQFNEVPFTPVDLINWKTFDPEQMAYLWLCIENGKSLVFAGGTASGKTTSLNAVSLFMPSTSKIVSIEDTREVELPQRNWIASVTRPSFTADELGAVDEFDLLEAALRQRPDYIVMGEVRGEEGRTLFQVMSTGHVTLTTFHADSIEEVIGRFTTDPISVSKTLFTALDLVSVQTETRVDGNKVRRSKTLSEINDYDAGTDQISVTDVFEWSAATDSHTQTPGSKVLDEIKFDRGWDDDRLDEELRARQVVLAYLILNEINTYTEVAATIQAFLNSGELVLSLIYHDTLIDALQQLKNMGSVSISVDPDTEEMIPRPETPADVREWARDVLTSESTDGGILTDRSRVGAGDADELALKLVEETDRDDRPNDIDTDTDPGPGSDPDPEMNTIFESGSGSDAPDEWSEFIASDGTDHDSRGGVERDADDD